MSWVRQGISTFFRQPLALSGLFFMFLAVMTLVGLVPVLGLALALALLPACTLGLMAASKEAADGKFPMPTVFLSAFRAGRQQLRAMLVLGMLYGLGFCVAMAVTALFDSGEFAGRYLAGQLPTPEMAQNSATQMAMLVFLLVQFVLSMMFWHAPALVHWYQIPPVKSVFFSLVACLRNFWAFALFLLVWMGILLGTILCLSLVAGLMGGPQVASAALMPVSMVIGAMFLTSTYFSFRDCFNPSQGDLP